MAISQAPVYCLSRSHVLLKLTADQVLVFVWIVGSCQVNLLKTEPGLKVKQIITVSSIHMFFVYRFCFFLIGFVIIKLRIEGQTIYRKLHRKVTNSNENSTLSWVSLIRLQKSETLKLSIANH